MKMSVCAEEEEEQARSMKSNRSMGEPLVFNDEPSLPSPQRLISENWSTASDCCSYTPPRSSNHPPASCRRWEAAGRTQAAAFNVRSKQILLQQQGVKVSQGDHVPWVN